MNIYPNESPLHQAFTHVASHADRVWWNEKDYGDVYKMANLNLYKNILKLSNRPANNNSIDLLMNNLENEKTMRSSVRAEQFFNWSFDACERRENSSNNLMESYQALFELIKSKDAIENNNKPVLPYNLETMDDIILYSSLHQSSVKNLWAEEKSMQEQQAYTLPGRSEDPDQVYDSELNANVPEFYPSVLLPPVQCPPRFPSVYDANYQADLFPFKGDANWTAGHQHGVNVLQNSELVWSYEESQSGTSAITAQYFNGSNVPVDGQSTATISHFPTYTVSLSNNYSLAAADFPELPKTQDTAIDIIRKTNIWLEAAFPKKNQDFKKLTEVAAHFDSLIRQMSLPQQGLICSQSKQPDRRLYRDVLAQKETEHEEKEDGGLEIKYEELEREALAQYRASETSLVPSVVTELSPELEENLEREALEQYSGDFHLELADGVLIQSKCTTAEDDSNELESPASTSFDRDQPDDGMTHVKIDDEEKCMTEEEQTSRQKDRLQQQHLSQSYQGKNRNRQRRGNKKKRGKWKGGGGSSSLGTLSVAGPSEEGCGEIRTESGLADHRSDTCMNVADDFNIGSSSKTKPTCFNYCEEENKRLCTELKHKALNYLKGVDLNLTGEIKRYSNKNTIKQLLYKGALPVPIVQSVKLEEIEDAETYKQYAKEVATSARTLLLSMFKRIRTELMGTTTTGNIIIVTPTTAEKRKVRHKIQKCVRLLERADHLKRVPRKPVESARNEVSETLKLLHRTMEVVYGLKEITRTAYENIEYLRKNNEILLEIYLGSTFVKDKTEYIQQKIFNEARNILLVLLFTRREGYLLDRVTQRLIINPEGEQIGYVHRNYITDSCDILTRSPNLELWTQSPYNESVRILNTFKYEHHKKKDLWANENWEHWLTVGNRSFAKVDLTFYGNVNILLMMNLVDNLQNEHINSRHYRLVSPNIINFYTPTAIEQYTCYFCQMTYPGQNTCVNNESEGGSLCVLNELNIRARSPLRLLMKTIFQGMKSSQCVTDEHWPVTPATSCTRIVQTDEQDDSGSDENMLNQLSHQQSITDSFINSKQLPKKTRNNDSTCSLQ